MIKSMTAFARAERRGAFGALTWELRSVNHRYLEVVLRLPENLRGLEPSLRAKANAAVSRGKLEGQLRFRPPGVGAEQLAVDEAAARAVLDAVARIEQHMDAPAPVSALDVLGWPGVVHEPEPDATPLLAAAGSLFEETLDALVRARRSEGVRIEALVAQRREAMREQVREVRARRPVVLAAIRERLLTRLAELPGEPDANRLEQELVYLAQKLDVDEELDRLETHLDELEQALARNEPVGRRLDFLMQELNREANTLSSKSADSETTQAAVELKVLIEQAREQVQNVE